jgi:hypothetical protein
LKGANSGVTALSIEPPFGANEAADEQDQVKRRRFRNLLWSQCCRPLFESDKAGACGPLIGLEKEASVDGPAVLVRVLEPAKR